MLFNSYTFAIFLVVVLALHNLPLPWRVKKFNLLWASYLFYAAWNPPFVLLLWISTVVDWFVARKVHVARSGISRKGWLLLSLLVNLGMLGFFKYGNFLLDNFVLMLSLLGIEFTPARADIILPVGISFYTFQTLSYTLDIYSGKTRPWDSFLDYALYVTFFPQLVAGPIVRSTEFLPQCREPRRADATHLSWGIVLLIIGLFQKVVVADGLLAPIVEKAYDSNALPDSLSAWCGTLAFAGQIYCDFAGYSSCAIGVAMCLGFRIPDNFRAPYAALGFSDFWSRWHISLSTWLRDYLYIPLGGNRKGHVRTYVNLMFTMLIGGLWHGASWTFVFWGGLHGLYLAVERMFRHRNDLAKHDVTLVRRFGLTMTTFILVCFAWVFFRANTFENAYSIVLSMLGAASSITERLVDKLDILATFGVTGALLAAHWLLRDKTIEEYADRLPWWMISIAITVLLFLIATMPGEDRAFIYFQF